MRIARLFALVIALPLAACISTSSRNLTQAQFDALTIQSVEVKTLVVMGTPQGDADQQRVVALTRETIMSKLKAFGKFDAANKRGQRLFVAYHELVVPPNTGLRTGGESARAKTFAQLTEADGATAVASYDVPALIPGQGVYATSPIGLAMGLIVQGVVANTLRTDFQARIALHTADSVVRLICKVDNATTANCPEDSPIGPMLDRSTERR